MKKVSKALMFILIQFLTATAYANCLENEKALKKDLVVQDLQQLESEFKANYAYYDLKKEVFDQELKKLRDSLQPENCMSDITLGISKMLALLDDGHTTIDSFNKYFGKQFIPFQISMITNKQGNQFVAYNFGANKKTFVKEGFPFVTHLDGIPITDWVTTAGKYKLNGRKYISDRFALYASRNAGLVRKVLNLPKKDSIKVKLSNGNQKTFEMNIKLANSVEWSPPLPFNRTKFLDKNNIGYLRIYDLDTYDEILEYDQFYEKNLISYYMMQDPTAISIRYWMQKFKSTNGLIIDIRGNPGGSRHIIQTLLPYLMKGKDSQLIYNVSAYRVKDPGDHPLIRFYKNKNDSEVKKALSKIHFNPTLPKNVLSGFGSYYYAVVSTANNDEDVYYYDKPIVLLIDDSVFSAADNLASAISQIDGVVTVGTETAGGSGGPKTISLKNSEIKIKYSFMASFKSTGELYNERGIVPKHLIEPNPEFFIGKSDPALEYSIDYLTTNIKNRLKN